MPAINRIHICGFKAFPNNFELQLEGKNLLMYGENGSGKSSIYYALHCMFQAPLKPDAGKKYFDPASEQHLKNLNNLDADSKIWIDFDGRHPFIYNIDKEGYQFTLLGSKHPLPAQINGCFVNHQFLFHFFNFRNSQRINLFPVFIKDILPFCKDDNTGVHIGEMYDEITTSIIKKVIELVKENGEIKERKSSYKKLNEPFIGLEISEKMPDGNLRKIVKPHTYFNEAKLTAIALAVRFALLNIEKPADGRFLALDDMLISLDMSNRAKVVDFLLKISDKYKIYLFTHDKAFFNYVCHEIHQSGKSEDWVYKRVSYNANNKEPIVLDEHCDYLSKAKHFYEIGDYDISAINIRKQLEQSVGELLPYELKVDAKGRFISLEKLWDKFVTFYSNNGKPLDPVMQNLFSDSKLLIRNVAAHYQRLSNPIYRIELDKAFKLVDYVMSLEKISNKLVIEGGKRIVFQHPTIDYKCSFELDSDLEIVQDEHNVARIPKCKNIRWSYNGVDNWDFESNRQNNNHRLLTASPKITDFFQRFPLGITHDMLMKYSKIEGRTTLIDYFGGIDLLKISVSI